MSYLQETRLGIYWKFSMTHLDLKNPHGSCLLLSNRFLSHKYSLTVKVPCFPQFYLHRIIELPRLEKTSVIIQSNHPPITNISH